MEVERIVLGAMTGTSLDGIDVAVARVVGTGLKLRAQLIAHHSAGLGPLGPRLRAAAEQQPLTAGAFAALALDFGHFHAEVCATAWEAARAAQPARASRAAPALRPHPHLAAVHGQTVFHAPPSSWQLINPHPIARALQCPVVYDLRGADLCEAGQGAPLTPLADWVLFRAPHARAVVNLGGFANATLLPAAATDHLSSEVAAIRGRDLCACNQLLDRAARQVLRQPFDRDGEVALSGTAHADAVEDIAEHLLAPGHDCPAAGNPRSNPPPARSLGTGDEAWHCLANWIRTLAPADLLASLADAVGLTVGRSLAHSPHVPRDVVVAGGGARHQRVLRAIRDTAGVPVMLSSELGIPVDQRESLGWAVLGALAQDGATISLPAVTGRSATLLADGVWCFPQGTRVLSAPA